MGIGRFVIGTGGADLDALSSVADLTEEMSSTGEDTVNGDDAQAGLGRVPGGAAGDQLRPHGRWDRPRTRSRRAVAGPLGGQAPGRDGTLPLMMAHRQQLAPMSVLSGNVCGSNRRATG